LRFALLVCAAAAAAAADRCGGEPANKEVLTAESGVALDQWARRSASSFNKYSERRLALLVAIHPPMFEEGLAMIKSCAAADCGAEADVFFAFASQLDADAFGARTAGRHFPWLKHLVIRKKDPRYAPYWRTSDAYPVQKKHAAAAQFLDDVAYRKQSSPYRYLVLVDAETAFARPASGFAEAVAKRAASPVWYGSDADDAHVEATWRFFSTCANETFYGGALAALRGRGVSARRLETWKQKNARVGVRPLNLWWVDLPWYDLMSLHRYLAFVRAAAARADRVGKVFEFDLYVSWLVAVEGRGEVRHIDALPTRRALADKAWIERTGKDALDHVAAAGVLWAPYYHLSPATGCALPDSVYVLFHRDRHVRDHKFKCCHPPWRGRVPETKYACSMPLHAGTGKRIHQRA